MKEEKKRKQNIYYLNKFLFGKTIIKTTLDMKTFNKNILSYMYIYIEV